MLNFTTDQDAIDPSRRHAFFEEGGQRFEVSSVLGPGYPCSVAALRPSYRHIGMIDNGNCEDAARQIARKFLAKQSV